MLFGLFVSVAGIVFLAWAMFRLAVYALPVWLGTVVFLWGARGEAGALIGALLGLIVGVAVFLAGRLLIASRLSVAVRAGAALLFALPAGAAGYSICAGLMRLGGAGPTATVIVAGIGAVIIAAAALASLLAPVDGVNRDGFVRLTPDR